MVNFIESISQYGGVPYFPNDYTSIKSVLSVEFSFRVE